MDVFDYLATTDPVRAKGIIHRHGYICLPNRDMAQNLRDLVQAQGEPALMDVMEMHPDRDFFMAVGKKKYKKKNKTALPRDRYRNADGIVTQTGSIKSASSSAAHQMNILIVVSAVILGLAIVTKK